MPGWQLRVLGDGALVKGQTRLELERKTAGLLAYLALCGGTSRSKLAGLLWPDSGEAKARNNLSQVLRRLRKSTGAELVAGSDILALAPELEADAATFRLASFEGRLEDVADSSTDLLCHFDYEDCLDFDDWLLSEREALSGLKRAALGTRLERFASVGKYGEALAAGEALLELDPVSEEAHRDLIRLHYLAGDRPAALKAYARCKEVLDRELGVEPLDETTTLAREIESGTFTPKVSPRPKATIPLSIQRPPVLVGRDSAWTKLEEAWERGQAIFVCGPAGVGKTRLVRDFAASKGPYLYCQARPGDATVPYASLVRSMRRVLEEQPQLELAPWVRFELSRVLPELADGLPPPQAGDAEKLRFYDAHGELFRLAGERLCLTVADDLHLYDRASLEVSMYLGSKFSPGGEARFIEAFRTEEVSAEFKSYVDRHTGSGAAVLIELEHLGTDEVGELVRSLELPRTQGLVEPLTRYTGGNPLFVVETLKSLYESGELGNEETGGTGSRPPRLPASGRVTTLIRRRLERLSEDALRLCWTAAVAGADFDLESAARVLERPPLDLAAAYQELEDRHILAEGQFSHDLLQETALAAVPAPIKMHLHGRLADWLEQRGASAARIALHYQGARDIEKAVPFLLRAAQEARAAFRLAEAADFFEQAAGTLDGLGDRRGTFDALEKLAELLSNFDTGPRNLGVLERLLRLAETPLEHARASLAMAVYLHISGKSEESLAYARQGQTAARATDDPVLLAQVLNIEGVALRRRGEMSHAQTVLEEALALIEDESGHELLPAVLNNLALVLVERDRHNQAIALFERSATLQSDQPTRIRVLNNTALSLDELGKVQDGLAKRQQALDLLEDLEEPTNAHLMLNISIAVSHRNLQSYDMALKHLGEAATLAAGFRHFRLEDLYRQKAAAYIDLGELERAEAELDLAEHSMELSPRQLCPIQLVRCKLLLHRNQDTRELLNQTEALLIESGESRALRRLEVLKAQILPPPDSLALARRLDDAGRQDMLHGYRIAALTRCAQACLAMGQPAEALAHARAAVCLLGDYRPVDFYLGEVFLTHYRALAANDHAEAAERLCDYTSWVLDIADQNVPGEYRSSFLENNPVNRAILDAARHAGIPAALGA